MSTWCRMSQNLWDLAMGFEHSKWTSTTLGATVINYSVMNIWAIYYSRKFILESTISFEQLHACSVNPFHFFYYSCTTSNTMATELVLLNTISFLSRKRKQNRRNVITDKCWHQLVMENHPTTCCCSLRWVLFTKI